MTGRSSEDRHSTACSAPNADSDPHLCGFVFRFFAK